ncbi:hypothetical protein E2542_SST21456 [Spatholobus suberectus]|nr:hypothetical protein E2542_SST21456 [Spatholobus suberectus]
MATQICIVAPPSFAVQIIASTSHLRRRLARPGVVFEFPILRCIWQKREDEGRATETPRSLKGMGLVPSDPAVDPKWA